ncbi:PAS domain-containing protein [Chondromyces apiculatus]|uniref:RsbR, positive regulator of sigma-B n=1 Tax=Chondromyces apiculatus DSM 436 TaxID=1192034 RepID=A0A017SWT2_9BACT|nr:PAS domain-containing protein [Chondromyces apiculatus]EYF01424.1 RsbR, positive regulator of sigma-B [Chondromyces apiculatus DSM 436]
MDADARRAALAGRFFDASSEMLCILDREGHVVLGNRAWTEKVGISPGEGLLGRVSTELQAEVLRAHLQDPKGRSWVGHLRRPGGGNQRFELSWTIDDEGLLHMVARHLDAEQLELRAVERLRALVRQTDLAIMELSGPSGVVSWNPAAEAVFGYTAEEALGRHLHELVGVVGEAALKAANISATLLAGQVARLVTPNRTKDGREITCAWQILLLRDERNDPMTVACFAQEITEVEAQRGTLEEQKRLLQALLTESPLVLWELDREGTFTLSMGSALRRLKLQEGEIVGANLFEYFSAYPAVCKAVRETLDGASLSFRADVGEGSWQNHLTPRKDEAGNVIGMLAVSFDVTEQARLEVELRQHIEMLTRHKETIRALSTPILQVWEGVLALPLVGYMDEGRAARLMDALLEEVARTGARHAIVDVTGVEVLDTTTVHHLLKLLQAIQLLGAEGILTGVRPAVAQSLVALGDTLPDVPTLRDLQAGLKRCLRMRQQER